MIAIFAMIVLAFAPRETPVGPEVYRHPKPEIQQARRVEI
jgi:hypothetical protein